MKILKGKATARLVLAMLVTVVVIGLSALAIHAPTQSPNPLTMKSVQTDKATTFYADQRTNGIWFVEAVVGTESKATENLEKVVAAL